MFDPLRMAYILFQEDLQSLVFIGNWVLDLQ